jgi:hypothetical protein
VWRAGDVCTCCLCGDIEANPAKAAHVYPRTGQESGPGRVSDSRECGYAGQMNGWLLVSSIRVVARVRFRRSPRDAEAQATPKPKGRRSPSDARRFRSSAIASIIASRLSHARYNPSAIARWFSFFVHGLLV